MYDERAFRIDRRQHSVRPSDINDCAMRGLVNRRMFDQNLRSILFGDPYKLELNVLACFAALLLDKRGEIFQRDRLLHREIDAVIRPGALDGSYSVDGDVHLVPCSKRTSGVEELDRHDISHSVPDLERDRLIKSIGLTVHKSLKSRRTRAKVELESGSCGRLLQLHLDIVEDGLGTHSPGRKFG